MTDLIPIEEINPAVVYTSRESIDGVLAQLQTAAEKHVPDLETDEGRKAIVSNAYKVRQSKSWLVKRGKELTADWRKKTKMVNELTNHVTVFCDELSDRLRAPVTEIEEREKAEREARRKQLEFESDFDEALEMEALFEREREVARKEAEIKTAEEARLAKEREAQAEKERQEREARIAKEAEERAKFEAEAAIRREQQAAAKAIADAEAAKEQAKVDAENARIKAEQDKIAAIKAAEEKAAAEALMLETERLAAEEEKKRIAAEKKAKEERLAANRNHRKKVNKEAAEGFAKNCSVDFIVGMAFVEAIEKGLIPHITINY